MGADRIERDGTLKRKTHAKAVSETEFKGFDFGFTTPTFTFVNNTTIAGRNPITTTITQFTHPMDKGQESNQLPAASPSILASPSIHVKPLHLRKASSHAHFAQSQSNATTLTNHDSHHSNPEKPVYPPRSSSIRNHPSYCDPPTNRYDASQINTPFPLMNSDDSSIAADSPGQFTIGHHSTANKSDPPTISSNHSRHLYPSVVDNSSRYHSSEIMGDFIPINSPNMAGLQPNMDANDDKLQGTFRPFRKPKINPYEFEPTTPLYDTSSQTTFNDFAKKTQVSHVSALSPRSAHVKNARSEENAAHITQALSHLAVTPTRSKGHPLYRSESSPNISQGAFASQHYETPSSEILQYYADGREEESSARRGREDCQESGNRGGQNVGVKYSSQSVGRRPLESTQERPSRSPTRHSPQGSFTQGHAINRSMSRSPTKHLEGVSEREEYIGSLPNRSSNTSPTASPKKRSRSPMKKMFGENGWLGMSPDEKPDLKPSKKPFVTSVDFANRPKKIGMMEKLKNKFEEIAEKADLGPMGRARSNSDKQKQTVLAISLGPPEQARVYMEIELMLVHTANTFLMNQFSQGRMDIDSIKKIVEAWKNKGRPVVIEFMYDQATQRELVIANQQNFRFHGGSAGSDIRINSMLYNWKQVANIMLIRTFCNADTVILKLLFDIEQILELLGAVEPMMIRLQQIRATATEMMRISRQSKDSKAGSHRSFRGREPPRNSESSAASTVYSSDDPYGGMKLVPDKYNG